MKDIPILYERKEDCCGCTACYQLRLVNPFLYRLPVRSECCPRVEYDRPGRQYPFGGRWNPFSVNRVPD